MSENNIKFIQNASTPDVRELYMKKAKDAYDNGEFLESVAYQTKSLCLVFNSLYSSKYQHNDVNFLPPLPIDVTASKLDSLSLGRQNQNHKIKSNPLVEYAKKFSRNYVEENTKKEDYNFYGASIEGAIEHMKEFSQRLPNEWTVLQICKEYDPDTSISSFQNILKSSKPLYLTLIKHPRSNSYPEPICIRISAKNQDEIFEQFAELTTSFKEYSIFEGDQNSKPEREKYWQKMSVLETKVNKVAEELRKYIGPWVCLFTGNITKPFAALQKKIFSLVDSFCDSKGLNNTQRILLSMLCRNISKLSKENTKKASQFLANNDIDLEDDISDFLTFFEIRNIVSFSPCMLIIDEKIDHFYWESVKGDQELCRFSSYHALVQLYDKYKAKIRNGYLSVNVKKGHCIVNPDQNLNDMEGRMKRFFSYWLSPFQNMYGTKPTAEHMAEILKSSDCYIYCGHGSGLQFINGHKISKMEINAVVFLFGCDSVRLRSNGLHSEMIGSHMYYHTALCPAVIGTLVVGFDFQMDKLSTGILSSWIPSKQAVHWSQIDLPAWKKGDIKPLDQNKDEKYIYEKSLAAIVAKTRHNLKRSSASYNTIGFVYRGLPVWNTSRSNL